MSERQTRQDKNVTSVIDQLRDREQAGLNKYGTNTERTDLDTLEWLQHLQEELMDGAVYIERLKGDVKELLRLSTEPSKDREEPPDKWHPGHEPQVAGHGDIHETEDSGCGITLDKDIPDSFREAGFVAVDETTDTPQHIKIPTDD